MLTVCHLLCAFLFLGALPLSASEGSLAPAMVGELQRSLSSSLVDDRVTALRTISGQSGKEAMALAQAMLRHADPQTRAEAVLAVCALDAKAGLAALQTALRDRDGVVRAAAVRGLGTTEGLRALSGLQRICSDKDVRVRRALVATLRDLAPAADVRQSKSLIGIAMGLLKDQDIQVRLATLSLASALPDGGGQTVLLAACRSVCEEVVTRAAERLATSPQREQAVASLITQVTCAPVKERVSGLVALSILAHPDALPIAAASLDFRTAEVRSAALECIAACSASLEPAQTSRYEQPIIAMLGDRDWGVRATAAETLARIGSAKAPPALIDLLNRTKDPDAVAALAALEALSQQSGMVQIPQWVAWWKANAKTFQPTRSAPPEESSSVSFYDVTDTFTNAVFVIDVSGSMAERGPLQQYKGGMDETKINGARAELLQTALGLANGTRFNVIFFRNQVQVWQDGPLRATWRCKRALQLQLEMIGPTGGTNTQAALEQAFNQPGFEAVFLLTDGMPTVGVVDTAQIIADVAAWNAERKPAVRLHTIAFYIEEAKDFLAQLAGANGGQYRFVN